MARIDVAEEADLTELLTLMRGYCDFYEVAPADEDLLIMSRALIADPVREGMQLVARDESGRAIGFATIFWTWSTTRAARIGVMNDLFVAPGGRGSGAADDLIAACVERCRAHGAARLAWRTAPAVWRAEPSLVDRIVDRIVAPGIRLRTGHDVRDIRILPVGPRGLGRSARLCRVTAHRLVALLFLKGAFARSLVLCGTGLLHLDLSMVTDSGRKLRKTPPLAYAEVVAF